MKIEKRVEVKGVGRRNQLRNVLILFASIMFLFSLPFMTGLGSLLLAIGTIHLGPESARIALIERAGGLTVERPAPGVLSFDEHRMNLVALENSDQRESAGFLLTLALEDKSISVRKRATLALGSMKNPPAEAVELLIQGLRSEDYELQNLSCQALSVYGASVEGRIQKLFLAADPIERYSAALVLRDMTEVSAASLKLLCDQLLDDALVGHESEVRDAARSALVAHGKATLLAIDLEELPVPLTRQAIFVQIVERIGEEHPADAKSWLERARPGTSGQLREDIDSAISRIDQDA